MKLTRTTILILVLVALSSLVAAFDTNNATVRWKFDGDCTDTQGFQDCSTSGTSYVDWSASGTGQAIWAGSSGYIDSQFTQVVIDNPHTVSFFWKANDTSPSGDTTLFGEVGNVDADQYWQMRSRSSYFQWTLSTGTGEAKDIRNTGNNTLNLWTGQAYHVCASYDGSGDASGMKLYIDGVLQSLPTVNSNSGLNAGEHPELAWYFGAENSGGGPSNQADGYFDEIVIYNNSALTGEQCLNLKNFLETTSSSPETFTITAKDYYNGSSIENFTAEIVGVGNFSTLNGTIHTGLYKNETSTYDIIIRSNSSGGYFNRTFESQSVNISGFFSPHIWQSVLNLNATQLLFNATISGGNFSVPLQSSSNGTLYLRAGTYNVTFDHEDYYDIVQEFTLAPLENLTSSITNVYNAIVNVSARNVVGNSSINSFSGSVYTLNYNTTNGYLSLPYMIGNTTNVTIFGTTFSSEQYTQSFSSNYTELVAYLYETGAIEINFYYEANGTPLTGVDVNILALNGTTDFTNNTGSSNRFYTTISDTGDLVITINKDGFSEKVYYETISTGRYVTLNAYLLTEDETQSTSFQVYNEINQLVGDAQLSFYRLINGTLERVAMKKTDFSGIATVNLDRGAIYVLRVTHEDYLQKEVSLQPSSLTYKVYLTGTSLQYSSLFDSVEYVINPSGSRDLYGNNTYDFSLSISAAQNNLDWWGVMVMYLNESGGLQSWINNQTISTGGFANITLTMPLNYTVINTTYFIKVDGYSSWSKNVQFFVYPLVNGTHRLDTAFSDYGDEINDFIKVLLETFITLGLVGLTARYITINSSILGLEILTILGGFTYVGWIEVWLYSLIAVPTLIIAFLTRGGQD